MIDLNKKKIIIPTIIIVWLFVFPIVFGVYLNYQVQEEYRQGIRIGSGGDTIMIPIMELFFQNLFLLIVAVILYSIYRGVIKLQVTKKTKWSILIAIILSVSAGGVYVNNFLSSGCGYEIVESQVSKNSEYVANVVVKNCGATTDYVTQVSIDQKITDSDNYKSKQIILIADSDHGLSERNPLGGPIVKVRWTGPNNLLIEYSKKTRTFVKFAKYKDIIIDYKTW